MDEQKAGNISWEIDVPVFRNNVILKELGIAVGIPFGLLIVILFAVSGGDLSANGSGYPLLSIGILFIAGFLFIMLIYGGSYAAGYVIDRKGILNYTQSRHRRKNTIMNLLLIITGLLSKRPSTAGMGLVAQTRQSVFINWKSIKKVKIYPNSRSIVVRGGYTEKIALFCSEENFHIVKDTVLDKFNASWE